MTEGCNTAVAFSVTQHWRPVLCGQPAVGTWIWTDRGCPDDPNTPCDEKTRKHKEVLTVV